MDGWRSIVTNLECKRGRIELSTSLPHSAPFSQHISPSGSFTPRHTPPGKTTVQPASGETPPEVRRSTYSLCNLAFPDDPGRAAHDAIAPNAVVI